MIFISQRKGCTRGIVLPSDIKDTQLKIYTKEKTSGGRKQTTTKNRAKVRIYASDLQI